VERRKSSTEVSVKGEENFTSDISMEQQAKKKKGKRGAKRSQAVQEYRMKANRMLESMSGFL
jgi:hypothetical protein